MKLLSVVGARPQFVKLSPVHLAATKMGFEHVIVHTGQHYDPMMSEEIFTDLDIPIPRYNLEVGSGSHAFQTGKIMMGLESIIGEESPDWVIVYGDTNSTIAAALTAVKIHVRVAHLEAGLRSGNRAMPEEHNRIATDHLSDILLAPTEQALKQLQIEGLGERSFLVGDVMVDACFATKEKIFSSSNSKTKGNSKSGAILATIHRAENTNSRSRLFEILTWLGNQKLHVRLLAHPRLISKCQEFEINLEDFNIDVVNPLNYTQMISAVSLAGGVITDSGGLQKEAFLLGTPCITVRTETEWPETVESGWNALDPKLELDVVSFFEKNRSPADTSVYGDGLAAERAIKLLVTHNN